VLGRQVKADGCAIERPSGANGFGAGGSGANGLLGSGGVGANGLPLSPPRRSAPRSAGAFAPGVAPIDGCMCIGIDGSLCCGLACALVIVACTGFQFMSMYAWPASDAAAASASAPLAACSWPGLSPGLPSPPPQQRLKQPSLASNTRIPISATTPAALPAITAMSSVLPVRKGKGEGCGGWGRRTSRQRKLDRRYHHGSNAGKTRPWACRRAASVLGVCTRVWVGKGEGNRH
jgi:hypothetical protein